MPRQSNRVLDFKNALSASVKLKNEQKYDWSTAYILKIFYKDWSHTKFFADYSKDIFSNRANLWPSGSYHQIKKDILKGNPMILVAGGAGANYVLDVISFIKGLAVTTNGPIRSRVGVRIVGKVLFSSARELIFSH